MLLHFAIGFNLICNMPMLNIDLLTPRVCRGGGRSAVKKYLLQCCCRVGGLGIGVFVQNIWYHVAAFVILFNLICIITMV